MQQAFLFYANSRLQKAPVHAIIFLVSRSDGMADVADSKSVGSDTVRVQVPPSARENDKLREKLAVFFCPIYFLPKMCYTCSAKVPTGIWRGCCVYFPASPIKGIEILEPRISNHGVPLIYFSTKRENVLVSVVYFLFKKRKLMDWRNMRR